MADLKEELSWVFSTRLIRWFVPGAVITFVLVYLFTAPAFIKPQYQSEAIIFVPLTLFTQQFEQEGIGFGSNAEIDGHIQILKSTRILDSLDKRFGLSAKLQIDLEGEQALSRFYKSIRSRISIEKTRYGSVSVKVQDNDPVMAATLANTIVSLGDIIKQDILLENRMITIDFSRDLYEKKQAELLMLEEKTKSFETQNPSSPDDYYSPSHRQKIIYEAELYELTALKNNYDKLSRSLSIDLPKVYVISEAIAPHQPVWPPRLLLSAAAALVYLAVAFLIGIIRK
ncbi:MAG: hypothetical protein IH591_00540 [Bacteroidales bacterium]|nr:hypothetical protein [Bacteroidales bacterium]